jgi:hypothetical protein
MNRIWRYVLVGAAALVVGLGLLEMALSRTHPDQSFSEIATRADEPAGMWQDYLDSRGYVLRAEIGPSAGCEPTETAPVGR